MKQSFTCSICEQKTHGFGNNPDPVVTIPDKRCCNDCNSKYVIPARLMTLRMIYAARSPKKNRQSTQRRFR